MWSAGFLHLVSLTPIYVDLLDAYERFLRVCGWSSKTVFAYTALITRFLPGAGRQLAVGELGNLEISALRSWFAWRHMVDPTGRPRMRRAPEAQHAGAVRVVGLGPVHGEHALRRVQFHTADTDQRGHLRAAPAAGQRHRKSSMLHHA